MSKKSFILFIDSLEVLDDLDQAQKAELFDAIRAYHKGDKVLLKGLMKAVFNPFKNQFDRDLEAWENQRTVNKINGNKGGRPKKPKETEFNPKKPNGFLHNQKNPVTVTVTDNVNVNDTGTKKPALSEFLDYSKDKSIELGYPYKQMETSLKAKYAAWSENKWINGNGKKIKNWKSAILNTLPHIAKDYKKNEVEETDHDRRLIEASKKHVIRIGS